MFDDKEKKIKELKLEISQAQSSLRVLELTLTMWERDLNHDKDLIKIIQKIVDDGDAKTENSILDYLRRQYGG
jgi:hypothetical protein